MTNNKNPLGFPEMVDHVEKMLTDPEILRLYDEGDKLSSSQTKHDVGHAFSVLNTARYLTDELHKRFPNCLSDEARLVVIPAGAFLHDIGRAISVDDHAEAGKKVAQDYLSAKGFPTKVVSKVAAVVACHRSDKFLGISIEALKKFPELAIVVIADKCVGDEDRVRPRQAFFLRMLRLVGLARTNFWDNAEHDRVNFAIKDAQLLVDSDDACTQEHAGAIVLKLVLDEKVAPAEELLSLYGKRFHSCGRAAKSLGFLFRIEVNSVRFMYDDVTNKWRPLECFSVQLP
jgi:hypothetical protein